MRKVTVLIAATASVLALAVPAVAQARDPILFVHGWNSSASTWNTVVGRFAADGWTSAELNTWSYNTAQSNATTAQQLASKVTSVLAATGAARLDLISHSMGGLSTRYYVKNLGGGPKVDEFVSLAGPNHGTGTANLCFWNTSCFEMRPGSSFLTALNSGDETPSTPRYGTWWSPCDEVINPDTSTILSGAANTQTPCLSHSGVKDSAGVYAQVREFVR
jgi:triacylglycerol lipase